MREAEEETGLQVQPIGAGILDLGTSRFPERDGLAEHLHYDIRFALQADRRGGVVSHESHALRWVPADEAPKASPGRAMGKILRQWRRMQAELGGEG